MAAPANQYRSQVFLGPTNASCACLDRPFLLSRLRQYILLSFSSFKGSLSRQEGAWLFFKTDILWGIYFFNVLGLLKERHGANAGIQPEITHSFSFVSLQVSKFLKHLLLVFSLASLYMGTQCECWKSSAFPLPPNSTGWWMSIPSDPHHSLAFLTIKGVYVCFVFPSRLQTFGGGIQWVSNI